jgi:hypothetical protein
MRKRTWLIALALVTVIAPLGAAPVAQRLGLGFGLACLEVRDDVLVPLAFVGPRLAPLELSYDRRSNRNEFSADCGIGFGPLFDRHGALGIVFPLSAGGQYLARVAIDQQGGSLLVGGQARWSEDIESLEYWDDEHFYWLTAIGAAPAVAYTRPVGANRRLDAGLALDVAALVSRPPLHRYTKTEPSTLGFFLSKGHEALHFATLDRYQSARWQVAWTSPLARTDFTITYRGRFARAAWPAPVMVLENSLSIAWGFRL